ncbi:diaminopimelate epimerase [Brevibacillus reuszeri]|uniref:Diaminopimelate epimerase n=1 Tax=Brevibacillus reuszeri TaxID=54915 RepID=A0A0K9YJY8_9BACL|nr:diaminopimelate epimerase [Brevibacillus reuszeri]KNB68515.1 diaminopimelate epimerase [Brevibacillus reuszeri]MED1858792.1 diaminopimelate epimerase [Brevibacillus reuszeri]GED69007.1 diaminopimelate epimerase [Brevibacillus reuszeri]
MKFTKLHGLGNDYVYVNCFEEDLTGVDLPELARRVSDRHFGIGGDGLILILPSERADFRMRVFNNDGSEAKNCGNGLRCVSKYVYDHGLTEKATFTVETLGGMMTPVVSLGEDGKVEQVTIDMGEPRFERAAIPMAGIPDEQAREQTIEVDGEVFTMTAVSMGNPHAIIFVDEVRDEDVTTYGPKIEFHQWFPERTNVEFIQILNRKEIHFRVWERGSGVTLACGTGACAAAVAASLSGKTDREVTVHLAGGDLMINWRESDNRVFMTGPATEIFSGVYQGEIPYK